MTERPYTFAFPGKGIIVNVSPKDERFLKAALDLGYLTPLQISQVCASGQGKDFDIKQIFLKQGLLSPQQVGQALKMATGDFHPKAGIPQYKTTLPQDAKKTVRKFTIPAGKTWGDYRIFEEIGRGGMAIVYKARMREHSQFLALKIMRAGTEEQSRRFLREARANVKLRHANILPIYAAGQAKGYAYIAMRYITGKTFAEFLERGAPLNNRLELLIKICHALQHAHDNGILHRDIKPSNILLDENDKPFLTDFGLAKFVDKDSKLTQSGETVGTPFYMSPEQTRGKKNDVSFASDIYSMGTVLYQTITGKLPFTAETIPALYRKIAYDDPTPPTALDPELPVALEAICLKALEKPPQLRYHSPAALAQDLVRFRKQRKVQALEFNLKRAFYHAYRFFAHSPRLTACILVFLALAISLPAYWWTRPKNHWQDNWRLAQRAFSKGKYLKALNFLDHVQGHPNPGLLSGFREKIYRQIGALAKTNFRDGQYQNALHYLDSLPPDSIKWGKLRVEVLEGMGKQKEMRLVLSRISELNPSPEDLCFMGDKALRCGYFRDAERYLCIALASNRDSIQIKKCLAQALLQQGKYTKAKAYYLDLPGSDAEVSVGLAQVYFYRREYDESLALLRQLNRDLSPYLQAQIEFIQARVEWERLETDLMRWSWLSGKIVLQTREKLSDIEIRLKNALTKVEGPGSYLQSVLCRKIRFYLQGIVVEQKTEATKIRALYTRMRQTPLSPGIRLFFFQVIARAHLRAKDWRKAQKTCDTAIEDFPCVSSLYHMRSLARFQLRDISSSLVDLDMAISLNRWDFLPIENMSALMYGRMTQREYNEFALILSNRFIFKPLPSVPKIVFDNFLENYRENAMQIEENFSGKERGQNWRPLLSRALDTDSMAVFHLLADILGKCEDSDLEKRLAKLRGELEGVKKHRVEKLQGAVALRKKREILEKIERLSLEYAVLEDDRYLVQVYRMGRQGKDSLVKILHDPLKKPLVRFLAARMLAALKTEFAYRELTKIAVQNSFPSNLLAAVALSQSGCSTNLPASSPIPKKKFYRILFALYLSPGDNSQLACSLLEDEDEMVALCASYNFRRYCDLPPPLTAEKVHLRLKKLLKSKDPYLRALACRIFWDFSEMGVDKSEEMAKNERESCRKKSWQSDCGLLLAALKDPMTEVQFAGLTALVRDAYSIEGERVSIRIPELASTGSYFETLDLLRSFYRNGSYFTKFWSAVILSVMDNKEKVLQLINDPDTPTFIRIASVRGLFMSSKLSFTELMSLAVEVLEDRSGVGRHPGYKQTALFAIGWNFTSGWMSSEFPEAFMESFRSLIEQNIEDPDPGVKRAAISALLWCGRGSSIEKVRPYLKSEDIHIQRAAATTLAGLTLRYRRRKLPHLQKSLCRAPEHIRKAAAYGYYELLRREINISYFAMSRLAYQQRYDFYMRRFNSALLQKSAKDLTVSRKGSLSLEIWKLALKNAAELDPCCDYYYQAALVSQRIEQLGPIKHRYLDARIKLQKALALVDKNSENSVDYRRARCFTLLGELYLRTGEQEKSRRAFQEALAEYPFNAKAHFYLGRRDAQLGRREETREHFWEAYFDDPALFSSWSKSLETGKGKEIAVDVISFVKNRTGH